MSAIEERDKPYVDAVFTFLREATEEAPGKFVPAPVLYSAFREFHHRRGNNKPGPVGAFHRLVRIAGVERQKTSAENERRYIHIRLTKGTPNV